MQCTSSTGLSISQGYSGVAMTLRKCRKLRQERAGTFTLFSDGLLDECYSAKGIWPLARRLPFTSRVIPWKKLNWDASIPGNTDINTLAQKAGMWVIHQSIQLTLLTRLSQEILLVFYLTNCIDIDFCVKTMPFFLTI